jgi:hypothetical protein
MSQTFFAHDNLVTLIKHYFCRVSLQLRAEPIESITAEIGATLPCPCGRSQIKYLDSATLATDSGPGDMHVSGFPLVLGRPKRPPLPSLPIYRASQLFATSFPNLGLYGPLPAAYLVSKTGMRLLPIPTSGPQCDGQFRSQNTS